MFEPVMTAEAVTAFLQEHFPQAHLGRSHAILSIAPGQAILRFEPEDRHLRPGGTVSGPALFALADLAAYAVLLAHVGPEPLMVTTNMTMNFMRRPPPVPLVAECRILKLGKRLAVVEVGIRPKADGDLVAHATATYSIPPR